MNDMNMDDLRGMKNGPVTGIADIHDRIQAVLHERNIGLKPPKKYTFSYGVPAGNCSVSAMVVGGFISWGVRNKNLIKRIPCINWFAQRVYWKLRSNYCEKMEQEK